MTKFTIEKTWKQGPRYEGPASDVSYCAASRGFRTLAEAVEDGLRCNVLRNGRMQVAEYVPDLDADEFLCIRKTRTFIVRVEPES